MSGCRRPRIPTGEWERHKAEIRLLYLDEKRKLEGQDGIIDMMQKLYGFVASKSQYETRLKKWNFRKYTTEATWKAVADALQNREGKSSEVYIHGELVSREKIQKELRRHRISVNPQGLLDSELRLPVEVDIKTPTLSIPTPCVRQTTPLMSSSPLISHDGPHWSLDNPSTSLARTDITRRAPIVPQSSHHGSRYSAIMNIQPAETATSTNSFLVGERADSFPPLSVRRVEGFTGAQTTSILQWVHKISANATFRGFFDDQTLQLHSVLATLPEERRFFGDVHRQLYKETYQARLVYFVVYGLINNLIDVDDTEDSRSPSQVIYLAGLQQIFSLSEMSFSTLLDSVPAHYTRALEQGLLRGAVQLNKPKAVRLLLQRGQDPNLPFRYVPRHHHPGFFDLDSSALLTVACYRGYVDIIRMLLEYGAGPCHLGFEQKKGETLSDAEVEIIGMLLCKVPHPGWENAIHFTRYYCDDTRVILKIIDAFQVAHHEYFLDLLSDITRSEDIHTVSIAVRNILEGMSSATSSSTVSCYSVSYAAGEALKNVASHYHKDTVLHLLDALLLTRAQPSPDCLFNAVKSRNMGAVEHFLALGVDANEPLPLRDKTWKPKPKPTALSEAVRNSFDEAFNLFEERGFVSRAVRNLYSLVPLLSAASKAGNAGLLHHLLRHRDFPTVDFPTVDFETPPSLRDLFYHTLARILSKLLPGAFRGQNVHITNLLLDLGVTPSKDLIKHAICSRNYGLLETVLGLIPDPWNREVSLPIGDDFGIEYVAEYGDIEVMKILLKAHFPVNTNFETSGATDERLRLMQVPTGPHVSMRYLSLLSAAVLFDNETIIPEIIKGGARLNSHKNRLGPLAAAVLTNNLPLVDYFFSNGADALDEPAATIACLRDQTVVLEKIIGEYTRQYPTRIRRFGSELLNKAIERGNLYQFQLLLGVSDIESFDTHGMNAIGAAIRHNRLNVLHLLLNHGVNIHGISSKGYGEGIGQTAILQSVGCGKLPIVRALVAHGADLHMPASYGHRLTALQKAAESGNADIVRYLLDESADPNEAPALSAGGTALQLAALKGHAGIAEILVKAGAEVNAAPARLYGRTAFEGAAEHGRIDMMLYLFEHGADLLSNDARQYRRAVSYAKKNKQHAACDLVEKLYLGAQERAREETSMLGIDDSFALSQERNINDGSTTAGNDVPVSLGGNSIFNNGEPSTMTSDAAGEAGTFNIDDWIANPSPGPVCAIGGF